MKPSPRAPEQCETARRELLDRDWFGVGPPPDIDAARHVEACEDCREFFADMRRLREALHDSESEPQDEL